MKSLKFLKPALAITLAIILGWLLTVRPAQAGYTVTLQQVGPDVVATGSGAIDLAGLLACCYKSNGFYPRIIPGVQADDWGDLFGGGIVTGATSGADSYWLPRGGPTSFGSGGETAPSSSSGDIVGTVAEISGTEADRLLSVPRGYVSGTFLSNSATYSGKTFATLGVTPGTYVWTWGTGADQTFTLQVGPNPAVLRNISTRARVETGDHVLIGGFIITGNASKKVIIRGIGPSLANHGVAGALLDPTLQLFSGHALLSINDNWQDTDQAAIQASGLAPSDPRESAIIATLAPGAYTVIESGVQGGPGIGLVEVYDLDGNSAVILGNISTRGVVESGDNVIIGGVIISGDVAGRCVIRALGPSLANYGIADALPNPMLEVHDSNGNTIATNDDWGTDPDTAELQNLGMVPSNDLESALVRTLSPGNYTAIVRSVSANTSGVALVEVYQE